MGHREGASATVRVGYLQFSPELGRVDQNRQHIKASLRQIRADLLVLPELATSGYALQNREAARRVAEPIPGPTTDLMQELARRIGGHIVVGLPEIDGSDIFNSAAVVGASGVVGTYRKTHLFWNEKNIFTPGDTGFKVWDVSKFKLGVMICFDWAFPEAAGTLARAGAMIIAHPSNLVLPHGLNAMPIRSLENRVFTITSNRTGTEKSAQGPLYFRGESMICSPSGETLARATPKDDATELQEIDLRLAEDKCLTPTNNLFLDRRPEFYR